MRTPDNAAGVPFAIGDISADPIQIILNSGDDMSISRASFLAAYKYLRDHNHNSENPVEIRSSNDADSSGPLCSATREHNNDVRCINYIIPILSKFGLVGFSGERPNKCWFL